MVYVEVCFGNSKKLFYCQLVNELNSGNFALCALHFHRLKKKEAETNYEQGVWKLGNRNAETTYELS